MQAATQICIEVVYALPERQLLLSVEVPAGSCAREALRLSGIQQHFSGLAIDDCPLGVFGQPVNDGHVLQDGDRLEIYRPLPLEPREQRRERARRESGTEQSEQKGD